MRARSVAAAAIDGETGELFQAKLTPSYDHITSWLQGRPGPVAVAYEAGPTGCGLYRHLSAAGIRCEVVAPSKLQKPSGDRVKTDLLTELSADRPTTDLMLQRSTRLPTAEDEADAAAPLQPWEQQGVNGQAAVPVGGQLKVPTPR